MTFLCLGLLPFNTKHRQSLIPEANVTVQRGQLVVFDGRSGPDEVGFMRLDKLGPFENLPSTERENGQKHHGIVGKERANIPPARPEYSVSIAYDDTNLEAESEYGAVGLEVTVVVELSAVDPLSLAGTVEEDVVDTDDDVVNDTTSSDNVYKPGVNLIRNAKGQYLKRVLE